MKFLPEIEHFEEIGAGAFSTVYRAKRNENFYALKLAKTDHESDIALEKKFAKEATVLGRIKHPSVVKVMDMGITQEIKPRPYLVLELIQGAALQNQLKKGALEEDEVIRMGKILAEVLSEIHQLGFVHRDIKPQNIIIEPNGGVRLIDFGLAVRSMDSKDFTTVGTISYSAPEQTGMLQRPVDGRSDLYSLGVILFECATGQLPFRSKNAGELLQLHASSRPPEVNSLNPKISTALSQIIAKLLAKDPDDRYQSGLSLLADLEAIQKLNSQKEIFSLGKEKNYVEAPADVPFIGRENEMRSLEGLLLDFSKQKGAVFYVEGEPGTGKSRLIREVMEKVSEKSSIAVFGKCTITNPVPLFPVKSAMDQLFLALENKYGFEEAAKILRKESGPYASLLKGFSPHLDRLLFSNDDSKEVSSMRFSQEQYYDAVSEFILNLSRALSGLMLIIDDVQWIDEGTCQIVLKLAEKISRSSLLLAFGARNDVESQAANKKFSTALQKTGPFLWLKLQSLDKESSLRLIGYFLNSKEVDRAFVDYIFSMSHGNPFALGEYMRVVLDEGLLRPHWGQWSFSLEQAGHVALSGDVIQIICRRKSQLNSTAQNILTVAAVIGSKFEVDLLTKASGFSLLDVSSALAEAVRVHLVEKSDGGRFYSFIHDRVQEAFMSTLSQDEKKQFNHVIALALDSLDVGNFASDRGYRLCRYWLQGKPEEHPQRVYDSCLTAGLQAKRDFVFEEAYFFLSKCEVYRDLAKLPASTELIFAMGEICISTRRNSEGIEFLSKVLPMVQAPLDRANVHRMLAILHSENSDYVTSTLQIHQGFEAIGRPIPSRKKMIFSLGWHVLRAVISVTWKNFGFSIKKKWNSILEMEVSLAALYIHISYFEIRILEVSYFTVKNLPLAYRTKDVATQIEILGACALVASVMGIKPLSKLFIKQIQSIEGIQNDPVNMAKMNGLNTWAASFRGDFIESRKLYIELIERYASWLHGWDYTRLFLDYIMGHSWSGHTLEGERVFKKSEVNGTQLNPYRIGLLHTLALNGKYQEAAELMKAEKNNPKSSKYNRAIMATHSLALYLEQEEFGEEAEQAIRALKGLIGPLPFLAGHQKVFYATQGYLRWEQYLRAVPKEKAYKLKKFKSALKELEWTVPAPAVFCHLWILKAKYALEQGDFQKTKEFLDRAETLARESDSLLGFYEISLLRYNLYKRQDFSEAAAMEIRKAYQIAVQQGWSKRVERLVSQFDFLALDTNSHSMSASITKNSMLINTSTLRFQRQMDALLQLGIACSKVTTAENQFRIVLQEAVKIFGADRAFLFLSQEDGTLVLKQGCGHDGRGLDGNQKHSRTLVDKVRETQVAQLMAGDENKEVSETSSIAIHNLKSIMAAPLMLNQSFLGVIYLDSTLTKGLFNKEDLDVLSAFGTYCAVAIETARSSQAQLEIQALNKDLESKKAIQNILDNLDQGFMAFGRDGVIQDGVSKSVYDFYGLNPVGQFLADVLHLDGKTKKTIQEWIPILFDEKLDFDDLKKMGPKTVNQLGDRHIVLDYRPIRNETKTIEKVIVISTDKTREQELENVAVFQAEKVKMVFLILENKDVFIQSLQDLQSQLKSARAELEAKGNGSDVHALFRMIHSVKGSAAGCHFLKVQQVAHQMEDQLAAMRDANSSDLDSAALLVQIKDIDKAIQETLEESASILSFIGGVQEKGKQISSQKLETFARELNKELGPQSLLVKKFYDELVLDSVTILFEKYKRTVQQIAAQQKKQIEIHVEKSPLKVLSTPYLRLIDVMNHLFRNAVDHGIESPQDRERLGKSSSGKIEVFFKTKKTQEQDLFQITVKDDGRGMDPGLIGNIAIKQGLIDPNALKEMNSVQILQLVFLPGFTTQKKVSSISGRGVGLDAVQTEVRALGGTVEVSSVLGKETCFEIEIPLVMQ